MAGIRKVEQQRIRPANAPRTEPTRAERGRREDFDARLGTNKRVRYPQEQSQSLERAGSQSAGQATEVEWVRERTLEELKTLVQAIQVGITDPKELTDLIFYARHPEMLDVPLTREHQELLDEWNQISALQVHPIVNEASDLTGANVAGGELRGDGVMATAFDRAFGSSVHTKNIEGGATHRYDEIIASAVQWCPNLSPAILKSLLAQESNFKPTVINQYGYAGIAQFGREAAREVGLRVGIAGSEMDERLDPSKAIPGAARLLNIKAQRLGEVAFARYGQPTGIEFWKFVLAAYNGGEGTVTVAMGHAYRAGMAQARAKGLVGTHAVGFARRYASQWENLKAGGLDSPLALAAARYFPSLAAAKYKEIGDYPTAIVARVKMAQS